MIGLGTYNIAIQFILKKVNTITDFISLLEEKEKQQLFWLIHDFIEKLLPAGLEASIKWNIPFYSYKGMLCYLNPRKKYALDIGFYRGIELSNKSGILEGDGKQVRLIRIKNKGDFLKKEIAIRDTVLEAALLNEQSNFKKNIS